MDRLFGEVLRKTLLNMTYAELGDREDLIPEEDGGNLYLINGNMTKLADAGLFGKNGGTNDGDEDGANRPDSAIRQESEGQQRVYPAGR